MSVLATDFDFNLPRGYVDEEGRVHRQGRMRLATAIDEVAPLRDPRVRTNEGYFPVVLLARVVTKLGNLDNINTGVIERLYAGDFNFLQEFYQKVNQDGHSAVTVECPECHHGVEVSFGELGESKATPSISSTRR